MLKRKNLATLALIGIFSVVGIWVARALFSDAETSAGNTFTTGKINLLLDNNVYYNGALIDDLTWSVDEMTGELLFDFNDLKPGDWGEDTLTLRVESNEAWGCVETVITKNDDNGSNDTELLFDQFDDPNNDFDGELAGVLEFLVWRDDGDNVLEESEYPEMELLRGTADGVLNGGIWALADSGVNNLGGSVGEGMDPSAVYHLGIAWCLGEMTLAPVADGENSPTVDPGFICNGERVGNRLQTDLLTGNLRFYVEQVRNNEEFVCGSGAGSQEAGAGD